MSRRKPIEPGPLTKVPTPPRHLTADAREVWHQVCAYLLERELLHSGDLSTIEAFALTVDRLRKLEAELKGQPMFTPEGKPHPGITTANNTSATIAKIAGTLGLAPVSRARLGAGKQRDPRKLEQDDAWLKALDGGKR